MAFVGALRTFGATVPLTWVLGNFYVLDRGSLTHPFARVGPPFSLRHTSLKHIGIQGMAYIIFAGLVFAACSTMTGPMGNAFLLASATVGFITSVTTVVLSMALGTQASLNDAVKSNLLSLVVAGLVIVFAFQVLFTKNPILFLASPALAFVGATMVLRSGLAITWTKAGVISAIGAAIAYVALKSIAPSILSSVAQP